MARIAKLSSEKISNKTYMTASEAAKELGIHKQTLIRWLKGKKVKGVRWGYDRRKWIYVNREDIEILENYRDRFDIVE